MKARREEKQNKEARQALPGERLIFERIASNFEQFFQIEGWAHLLPFDAQIDDLEAEAHVRRQ